MIEVDRLNKSYGPLVAVEALTFSVNPGEIFGLLGPNGAGKTTALGCISGFLTPTAGQVRLMGHDVVRDGTAARKNLGIAPQEVALFEEISAIDNLNYWGGVQGMRNPQLRERSQFVLQLTGLQDRAREPVKRLSDGMKRRLNFACAIIHRPGVLLLDEPTAGVDPQSRIRLLELVRAEARAGACVLYTTHYLEEAESLCDRLAIIDQGRMIAAGSVGELRAVLAENDLLRITGFFPPAAAREAMSRMGGVEILQEDHELLLLSLANAGERLPSIFTALATVGAEVRRVTVTEPCLESLFIKLTGKELRE